MLIVCPNCATSYQVASAALGSAGRSVRCSRCQNTWFAGAQAMPTVEPVALVPAEAESDPVIRAFRAELGPQAEPAPEPQPVSAAEPRAESTGEAPAREEATQAMPADHAPESVDADPAAPGLLPDQAATANATAQTDDTAPSSDTPAQDAVTAELLPVADAPPLQPAVEADLIAPSPDIETIARRKPVRRRTRRKTSSRWPLAIVGLVAVLASLLIWRGAVVQQVPQLASLYAAIGLPVNLRGLTFDAVTTTKDMHDGVPVLVVEGKIENPTRASVDVPRLRFSVQDTAGKEIYTWTAQPPQPTLEAGATLPFRSRLASPPAEAHSVLVRFFSKHDMAGGAQ